MDQSASSRLIRHLFTCIALQAFLLWSLARSQQPASFLSIDYGSSSPSTYIDDNGIEWIPDSNLTNEGTSLTVSGQSDPLLATMRLFDGNQSKYCYSLTNRAVETGAFFLVRVGIATGTTTLYTPKDGNFQFTMIVDATVWRNVSIPYGETTLWTFDMYTRAQRTSIDFCLARTTSDGNAPFISVLELRPLPSNLSATLAMDATNAIANCLGRIDIGVPADSDINFTRYKFDPLDRLWISMKAQNPVNVNTTTAAIDVRQVEQLPSRILQTTFMGRRYITWRFSNLEYTGSIRPWIPNLELKTAYFAEF
ncbi:hypothetical protein L7F22_037178 [Adiantum nelumboides]|nr:hypothetical protein [Adiantum nelumboides]